MKNLQVAVMLLGLGCISSPASALISTAWVSRDGADASTCGAALTPCRTIQFVLNNIVTADGEINVHDPANYGSTSPILITKSISINGVGASVLIHVTSGPAIRITAGPNDQVTLRGLTIDGSDSTPTGIQVDSVGSLRIENTSIFHLTGIGVNFTPTGGNFSQLMISNSNLSQITGGEVVIRPTGAIFVAATLAGTTFGMSGGTPGVKVDATATTSGANVKISDCVFDSDNGVAAVAPASGFVGVAVYRSSISNAQTALTANGNAHISVDLSFISNVNTVASTTGGGLVRSFGNNAIDFFQTLGPLGSLALQ